MWPGIGPALTWGLLRHPAPPQGVCPCCVVREERKGKVEEILGTVCKKSAVVVVRLGSSRYQYRHCLLGGGALAAVC